MITTRLSKVTLSKCVSSHLQRSSRGMAVSRILERRDGETGSGGRNSNAGVKVAVFGASSFLGRYVCGNLGTNGVLAYLGNRGDEFELRHLRPMFDLGRSRFVFYSSKDRDSMAEVIADADIVINLIGKHYETRALANKDKFPFFEMKTNFTLEQANVDIPRTVAELCTEMQIDNLIHVSALGASPDSSCEWSRTKHAGEMAVKEAYPWATIIRPAHIFGSEDRFLNWYANAAAGSLPFVPFVDGGEALTQPVYVDDVASIITRVVDEPEKYEGKTIDCFGPQDFTQKELAEFVYDITSQFPRKLDLPKAMVKTMAKGFEQLPYPILTQDMVEHMAEDVVPSMTPEEYAKQENVLTMEDLGIKKTPIEKIAFNYLHRFRAGGHFILAHGYHDSVK